MLSVAINGLPRIERAALKTLLDAHRPRHQPIVGPKPRPRTGKRHSMPRQFDFRVHALADTDVLVFNDTDGGSISIVIEQPSGIGVEARLTTDQAATLAHDLQRELKRA
jgi:hypothetical protein